MGPCVSRGSETGEFVMTTKHGMAPTKKTGETASQAKRFSLAEPRDLVTFNIDEMIGPGECNPSNPERCARVPSRTAFQPTMQQPRQADSHVDSKVAVTPADAEQDWEALNAEARAETNRTDNGSLEAHYTIGTDNIGQGTFGVVKKVTHKQTGLRAAVKIVRKDKVKNNLQLQHEVANMWNLDHPNIVKLYDAFDDGHTVSFVLELCTGGELFHAISKARRFSEQDTAFVMDQMLRAVSYLHRLHICHRDLKPENFLLLTTRPITGNVLKLIDFGLSIPCSPEDTLTEVVGTASYVAPQVLFRSYNNQCDLWSCGIIMYIMLCGHPPFRGRNQQELLAKVRDAGFVFDAKIWTTISRGAKSMISMLLQKDPTKRYTAEQALTDPWLFSALPGKELLDNVTPRTAKVRSKNSKRSAMRALSNRFPLEQVVLLGDVLRALDTDNDGMLSIHDLREGLLLAGAEERNLEDFTDIATALDDEGVGYVDYYDLLASFNARANESRVCIDNVKVKATDAFNSTSKLASTPGTKDRVFM